MFEIIKSNTKIDFVAKFSVTAILSILVVLGSIYGIVTKMDYGVDFRGGAEIQLKFKEVVGLDGIRRTLKDAGFKGIAAQSIGEATDNEFLVKVQGDESNLNEITDQVSKSLSAAYSSAGVEVRKVDIVGPKAGAQLRISGFQAMLWALIAIMIYIGLRFDFKYSPGAIVALFHDVTIILGIFAFFHVEFTLQTVAALLAVIGYSVNDTVIVYDRVREHEDRNPEGELSGHINVAINETLSRTIMTSLTTLFVSGVMYAFGGLAIKDFFLAISLGVVIGTYSSIFVAAPVTLFFDRMKGKEADTTAKA